jgi:hypothetical protein
VKVKDLCHLKQNNENNHIHIHTYTHTHTHNNHMKCINTLCRQYAELRNVKACCIVLSTYYGCTLWGQLGLNWFRKGTMVGSCLNCWAFEFQIPLSCTTSGLTSWTSLKELTETIESLDQDTPTSWAEMLLNAKHTYWPQQHTIQLTREKYIL